MKLPRRKFLRLAAGAAALPAVSGAISRAAWAQAYPTKPVRIAVGFAAGGTTDIAARLIGQWLTERLGQPFIVENRPGASTNIAVESVVRAAPDGYTLLAASVTNAINATFFPKLNFNMIRDIAMISGIMRSPLVLVVNPALPVNTVPEFIAYAKANPRKITMASFGAGTSSHVAGELFKSLTGTDMVHVPYRGSAPMVTDLLGGQVQAAVDNLPASIEHIKTGKLRALAVMGATRTAQLPQVPALNEYLPGFEATAWITLCAPKSTPAPIVELLNREVNAALADAKIKAKLANIGGEPLPGSSAALDKYLVDETEKWGKVLRAGNIKAE